MVVRDWINIILTAVIAVAAFFQALFARRLAKLQDTFEQSRKRVDLFCTIEHKVETQNGMAIVKLVNLSSFGIWVEGFALKGKKDGNQWTQFHPIRRAILPGEEQESNLSNDLRNVADPGLRGATLDFQVEYSYWALGEKGTFPSPIFRISADQKNITSAQTL